MEDTELFEENERRLTETFKKTNETRPPDKQFSEYRIGEMARDLIDLLGLGVKH